MPSFTQPGLPGALSTRTLSPTDLNGCTKVEQAAFPPVEAFSHDAGVYRLTKFPEICLGLFYQPEDAADSRPLLVGHVIATRETPLHITTEMMEVPAGWDSPGAENEVRSSNPESTNTSTVCVTDMSQSGGSVAVHSLAIDPQYQGKGLGPLLMRKYIAHLKESVGYAERVVILAHGPLVGFYERLGFENDGESECQFAEGGWFDMVSDVPMVSV